MRTVRLSAARGETAISLFRKSFTAAHPRLRERLVALALIAIGLPATAVAQQLGRNRGTIEQWVHRFNAHGLEGLCPTFRGQPGTRLSPEELEQLRHTVQRPPRQVGLKTGTWSGKAVVAFVKRRFGTTISGATARRSLHRLGFRRKRPRKRCVKADPEAQKAFAQAWQAMEQCRAPGSVTVSRDQGPIWQDALPRLGWFLGGQPAWVDSTSPAKRAKVLFSVAVVRPLGMVITMLCTWFDQATTAKFLGKVRRCLRGRHIDLILENASHQKGTVVEEALAPHRIEVHPLPAYSPQMNGAEQWIRWAKEVLSANICWQDLGALVRSFIGFVASMTTRPTEVRTRCVPDMLGFSCV